MKALTNKSLFKMIMLNKVLSEMKKVLMINLNHKSNNRDGTLILLIVTLTLKVILKS